MYKRILRENFVLTVFLKILSIDRIYTNSEKEYFFCLEIKKEFIFIVVKNRKGERFMLKNIPSIISPELMKALMEMGHGDEIVLTDGNYPSASAGPPVIRANGHGIPELLSAILSFFPLDTDSEDNVIFMKPNQGKNPPIWFKYDEILKKSKEIYSTQELERFKFYHRASHSYCIVASSEKALYANIILKKGVVE